MTEPAEAEALFSELVERHGGSAGIARLSGLDREIIGVLVKLLIQLRTADGADVARLAGTVAQLTATLPTPSANAEPELDLSRYTDRQLEHMLHLHRIGSGEIPNDEPEPEPEPPPPMGPAQLEGDRLGKWIDENCDSWTHRRLRTDEELIVRNGFQGMARNFIARHVFRDIFFSEMQNQVEDAVKRALAAAGSDARVVPLTAEERRQIEPPALLDDPPEPPHTNGAGDLTAVWPFSPDKPPQ